MNIKAVEDDTLIMQIGSRLIDGAQNMATRLTGAQLLTIYIN